MMKDMPQGQKKKSAVWGFTLIELLVASAIFIVVSMVVVSISLMAIVNQRRDFQVQNLEDNARYMIEAFSKEVRMSEITSWSATKLTIKNQYGDVVVYEFKNNNLERGNLAATQPMNSNDVVIQGAFSVISSGQPMVTIVMTFYPKVASQSKITVQNTIAVRLY